MTRRPSHPSFQRKPEFRSRPVDRVVDPVRRATIIGIASLLSACAAKPIDPERFFRPDLLLPEPRTRPGLRIVVEPFQVQGIYADRALVSRDATGTYRQAIGRSWIGPPSLLLGEALVDYLRAAYGRDAVFAPQARVSGDLLIRPQLKRFERVLAAGGDQAQFAADFVVSGHGGALLGQLVFSESAPAGTGPGEYVAAQSALLGQAAAQLLTLLDTLVSKAAR